MCTAVVHIQLVCTETANRTHAPCSGCLGRRVFARPRLQAGAPQLYWILLLNCICSRCGFVQPTQTTRGAKGEVCRACMGGARTRQSGRTARSSAARLLQSPRPLCLNR